MTILSTVTPWQDRDPLSPTVLNSKLSPIVSSLSALETAIGPTAGEVQVQYLGSNITSSTHTLDVDSTLTVSVVTGVPRLSVVSLGATSAGSGVQVTYLGSAVTGSSRTLNVDSTLTVSTVTGIPTLSVVPAASSSGGIQVQYKGSNITGSTLTLGMDSSMTVSVVTGVPVLTAIPSLASSIATLTVTDTLTFSHADLGPAPVASVGWLRISNDPTIPVMAYRNDSNSSDWPVIQIGSATQEDDVLLNGWLRMNPVSVSLEPLVDGTGYLGGQSSGYGFAAIRASNIKSAAVQSSTLYNGTLEMQTVYPYPSTKSNAYALLTGSFDLLRFRAGNPQTEVALMNGYDANSPVLMPWSGCTVDLGRPDLPWDKVYGRQLTTLGVAVASTAVSSDYTATVRDHTILATSSSTMTIELPSAASVLGSQFVVKRMGTGFVWITATSGASFDANAALTLGTLRETYNVQSVGTYYAITGYYKP